MQLWQDGLMAMLAAVGLASLLWMVVRAIFFRSPQLPSRSLVTLIPAQGAGEQLEQQLRAALRLRREQGLPGRILLVDCGLNDEGRKLAELLAREDRWVAVCRMEEIGSYLEV